MLLNHRYHPIVDEDQLILFVMKLNQVPVWIIDALLAQDYQVKYDHHMIK